MAQQTARMLLVQMLHGEIHQSIELPRQDRRSTTVQPSRLGERDASAVPVRPRRRLSSGPTRCQRAPAASSRARTGRSWTRYSPLPAPSPPPRSARAAVPPPSAQHQQPPTTPSRPR
uniref:Uncharacterized protein n=1 Tax=Triticum urartu TaxID=4572 RepID=A0A8R7V098_TRIUA